MATNKLEQFNEEAIKKFLLTILKMTGNPTFALMYSMEDWKGSYESLSLFGKSLPYVVDIYNAAYHKILTESN